MYVWVKTIIWTQLDTVDNNVMWEECKSKNCKKAMQILCESTNTGVKWKQDRWSDYISRLDTIDINAASEEADEDCVQIASLTSDKPIHLSKDEVMRRMVMLIIIIVHLL